MTVNTYLFFNGNCEAAIQLYSDSLDAQTTFVMRYKDGPPHLVPPQGEDLIFHATVKIGDTTLNMGDLPADEVRPYGGFALLVHIDKVEVAEAAFAALSQGGLVKMPLEVSPWAMRYGIVVDKFGVTWKIQVNE